MEKKHIVVIAGSIRPGNQTLKAMKLVVDELQKREDATFEAIDPAELTLALPGGSQVGSSHDLLQEKAKRATGVILVSPEYHGGISSVMKLIIDNLGFPSVLAGKPIALLGVAEGSIGAIKSLEQLRSICSHIGAIVLPGSVSIARVSHVFDEKGKCLDKASEERIRKVPHILLDYIEDHICPKIALENMVREKQKGI